MITFLFRLGRTIVTMLSAVIRIGIAQTETDCAVHTENERKNGERAAHRSDDFFRCLRELHRLKVYKNGIQLLGQFLITSIT